MIIAILFVSIIFIIFVPFFLGVETGQTQCFEDVCFPELMHVSVWDLFLQHIVSYEPCESELGFFTCLVIQDQTLPQIFGFIAVVIIIVIIFKYKKIKKL